jgi:phage terminase small subunit
MELVKKYVAEFGLSPSSRARMAVPGNVNEDDEMEQLLKGA